MLLQFIYSQIWLERVPPQPRNSSHTTVKIYIFNTVDSGTVCFSEQAQVAQNSWTVKIFSVQCVQCMFTWRWSV